MTLCKSSSEVCFTAVRSVKSENFTGLQIDERDRMAGYAFLTEKDRKKTVNRQTTGKKLTLVNLSLPSPAFSAPITS